MATIITESNEGPVVNIAAWIGITLVSISILTRICLKYAALRAWFADDTLIVVTMVGKHSLLTKVLD
jgi:hypothetical protein